ncbi:hypothetical protein ACFT7S_07385 [Streptomyces sp. NPDC057136]|uniref:hypothetical protein n=1 Tax=Streptomyces sp. NPDC057136 TaxID=3346029 RepID=UPI00363A146B
MDPGGGEDRQAVAGPDVAVLHCDPGVRLSVERARTRLDFTVSAGQRIAFILGWSLPNSRAVQER